MSTKDATSSLHDSAKSQERATQFGDNAVYEAESVSMERTKKPYWQVLEPFHSLAFRFLLLLESADNGRT
eukprot:3625830-Amphidinium_carterae.2